MLAKLLAVEKYLTDLWSAIPDLEGVQVARGRPDRLEAESLWTAAVKGRVAWAALGAKSRNLEGTIPIVISVLQTGGEHDDVTDRLTDLYGVLDDSVSGTGQKVTVAGTVIQLLLNNAERITVNEDDARRAVVTADLEFTARI